MKTWTCRCGQDQLVLREIRIHPKPDGSEHPTWVYQCPKCGSEAVAASQPGAELHSCAPMLEWLIPADQDDSELPGRAATPVEVEQLGDILALNPARDEHGRRVVWR